MPMLRLFALSPAALLLLASRAAVVFAETNDPELLRGKHAVRQHAWDHLVRVRKTETASELEHERPRHSPQYGTDYGSERELLAVGFEEDHFFRALSDASMSMPGESCDCDRSIEDVPGLKSAIESSKRISLCPGTYKWSSDEGDEIDLTDVQAEVICADCGEKCIFDGNGVHLKGGSRRESLFASGAGSAHDVLFQDITFQNAYNTDRGGVFGRIFDGSTNFVRCAFDNNQGGDHGGAIFFERGTSSFVNCNFTNNFVLSGSDSVEGAGAIAPFNKHTSTITGSLFRNNTAGNLAYAVGGAIWMFAGAAGGPRIDLSDTKFDGNKAFRGGAIYVSGGTLNCNGGNSFEQSSDTVSGAAPSTCM